MNVYFCRVSYLIFPVITSFFRKKKMFTFWQIHFKVYQEVCNQLFIEIYKLSFSKKTKITSKYLCIANLISYINITFLIIGMPSIGKYIVVSKGLKMWKLLVHKYSWVKLCLLIIMMLTVMIMIIIMMMVVMVIVILTVRATVIDKKN